MNKNTAIGLGLIALILIGYSWYNTRLSNEQAEQRRVQDSIAVERQMEFAKEFAEKKADSLSKAISEGYESIEQKKSSAPKYADALLDMALNAEDSFYTLENDKIKVKFTSRGAQPLSVLIKDVYTYDSLDLYLMREGGSMMNIEFYTDQLISSKDFSFTRIRSNDSTLVMRLDVKDGAYIDFSYTLPHDSYLMDFNVAMVGMEGLIPRNVNQFELQWNMSVPRLEKGYQNEKNYSTIAYRYPNSSTIETLGLRKDSNSEQVKTRLSWFAFQPQFFSAIMVAKNGFTSGALEFKFYNEDDPQRNLMLCNARMQIGYEAKPGEINLPFEFYFGPNHFKTLKSYGQGFEKIVPMGGKFIGSINRFFVVPVFDFLSKYIGSYGIIILIMTILIKLIISPLTLKSYMSSAKMKVIKPEVDKINAKYPKQEDAMKKQQETMALYKKSGVNMFGGCLPMLLQMPILFALFRFFPASFELRQQSFLWAKDLSAYDSIINLPFSIPMYGDHVSLFALLMAISMHFYARMTMDQMAGNPQMAGMKVMQLWFMPIFLLVFCNNLSSGLSYYYMLSNFFTIAQTWVIRRFFVDEEKIMAQIRQKSSEPVKKSKFQQRLEAAQKMQQQQQTQNKKR